MSINRKQLSLIIRDDELYHDLIKPHADSGELNNLIIRCLSAYYYNNDVRDLVDNVQKEDSDDRVQVKSTQDAINDIRQALAMQSFYADTLKDEMEAGIEDMSNILKRTTEKAEEDGLVKTEQTDSGNTIARITMKTKVSGDEVVDFAKLQENMLSSAHHGDYSGAFEANAKMQTELADKLNMIISLLQTNGGTNVDLSNIVSTVSRTEVFSDDDAFAPDIESVTPVRENNITEVQVNTSNVEGARVEEPKVEEPKVIDGSDAINDLLSSLTF